MKKITESVSVVIPAYQEGTVIGEVVSKVKQVLSKLDYESEIIVVDDGSSDNTGKIARKAGAHVVMHPRNKGYGASLKTGIRSASYRTVVTMDADGQHNPEDIPRLIEERATYDMVIGARKGTAGSPSWRKPGKVLLGWLANGLAGRKISDLNSGYRAFDRQIALRFLSIMPNGFSFSTTSTIAMFKSGLLVQYIPIEVAERVGNSTVTVADGFNTLMLVIRIMTLFSPLRVFLPVSTVVFIIGSWFTIQGYLQYGEASVKGLIALLAAAQFFFFGILVDQVVAIRRGEHIAS